MQNARNPLLLLCFPLIAACGGRAFDPLSTLSHGDAGPSGFDLSGVGTDRVAPGHFDLGPADQPGVPPLPDVVMPIQPDIVPIQPDIPRPPEDLPVNLPDITGLPFMPAPHAPFPSLPDTGGPVSISPQIVTITFAGDPFEAQLQAYGDWIVTSSWLATVGRDYGITTGKHVAKVVLNEMLPSVVDDSAIQSLLLAKVQSGELPAPVGDPSQTIYLFYYPENVTITLTGEQSCQTFGGYHQEATDATHTLAYGVVANCESQIPGLTRLQNTQISASHEIIEAATDPFPFTNPAWGFLDPGTPWTFVPGEVADLCVYKTTSEAGFVAQRVWSNTAAAQGSDPCVPTAPGDVYFGVTAEPGDTQVLNAGGTIDFTVRAWSTAPHPKWNVAAQASAGSFSPQVSLSRSFMGNGDTAILTVLIPAGTPSQSLALVDLISYNALGTEFNLWPVAVFVP